VSDDVSVLAQENIELHKIMAATSDEVADSAGRSVLWRMLYEDAMRRHTEREIVRVGRLRTMIRHT
jgi:hypothetical protein